MRTPRLACLLVMAALFAVPSAGAQPSDDLKALRQDIEAIRKELQEIKDLLRARPAPQLVQPAAPPQDFALDLTGAPVKGAPAARVVMLEYSDYQ